MLSGFFPRTASCRRGFALVLVLSFVVLLTFVVLAFLSRALLQRTVADSSANQTKVDLFAKGAIDTIVGDLRQEISDGSLNGGTSQTNGNTVTWTYSPTSNATVVPYRAGSDSSWTNLVKRSSYGTAFYPAGGGYSAAGQNRAANISTTKPSKNGRSYSAARWNKALLLPPKSVTDLTPNTTQPFVPPDWILVDRSGGNPTTWNQNLQWSASPLDQTAVVGRYAYTIYDEGGLLDINVAGYPTSLLSSNPSEVGKKGIQSYADLTQVGLTTPQIDSIVNWRNYASIGGSPANYINFVASNPNGFMKTANTSLVSGQSDRMFMSRQQLIDFFNKKLGGGAPLQNTLQYLGTFSRELNAPSWSPTTPPGSTVSYAAEAENSTAANRNIPNVRFSTSGTLTRYRLDGSSYTKSFNAGDAVVQMRFPLGRLAWLTPNGPKAGMPDAAAAIKLHFGLVWDSSHLRWEYVTPEGSTGSPAAAIKTLGQVSQEKREPDFFELLKAGILAGSLGKTASDPTASPHVWKNGVWSWADTGRDDVNVDLQVLRIGANIIDQATPGSIPTDIRFVNNQVAPSVAVDAFGIKSLPYIAWIPYVVHRPERFPARNMIGCWYAFEVWDPHQNAGSAAAAGSPVNFRIRPIQGTGQLRLSTASPVTYPYQLPSVYPATGGVPPPVVAMDTNSYIYFTRDSGRTFSDPTLLQPSFASATGPNDSCTISAAPTLNGVPTGTPPTALEGAPGFVGFNVGLFDLPDKRISGETNQLELKTSGITGSAIPSNWPSFEVQLQDPVTGAWRTYQQVIYLVGGDAAGELLANNRNTGFQLLATQIGMYNPDPRTERFGAFGGHGPNSTSGLMANLIWGSTNPAGALHGYMGGGPGWMSGSGLDKGYPDASLALLSFNNTALKTAAGGSWVAYNDPDGILREGDSSRNRYPMIPGTTRMGDRPVILGRPFRSVGELGYAYRDMPWKTLDFFTKNSADAALLDLFTVSDAEVTAGKLNLNTRSAPALQSLLVNAVTTEIPPIGQSTQLTLSGTQAANVANALVKWTGTNSLLNRGDLVPAFADSSLGLTGTNMDIKTQRESAVRALAEAGTTRTWNLLIDVIAQSGRYGPGSTGLSDFLVEGEARYWAHIAIDRFTGQVIDVQLENVYE